MSIYQLVYRHMSRLSAYTISPNPLHPPDANGALG